MLASLFEFIRDLAIIAAAVGIARCAWDWYANSAARRDDTASAALAAERHAADVRQLLTRLEDRATGIVQRFEEITALQRQGEDRITAKVRVHRLLQTSDEPFLTFAEMEQLEHDRTRAGSEPGTGPLAGDGLRRILIELVSDGVIAQMDQDRYFIASDFETPGDGNASAS